MIDSWDRLRVFAAVARHQSVSAAAKELHLTGPAVSHHVRSLERELGTRVVERDGRGIRLTVAGRLLAERAHDAAAAVAAAEAQIEALAEQVSGPVRLGATGTMLRRLAPALGECVRTHPRLSLEVVDAETVDLLPRLRRDELDLVVAESWSPAPRAAGVGLVSRRIREERAWVAVPVDHAAAAEEVVSVAAHADEPWATCAHGSDAYLGLRALLAGDGRTPRIPYCVNDFATALALVDAGLALALVTDLSRPECGDGVVLRKPDPSVTRVVDLVARPVVQRPAVAALGRAIVGNGVDDAG